MENSLQHHGIKGQKWGRRRFQYKDGTLTPAGKKRYDNEYMHLKEEKKVLTNKKKTAAKIQKLDDMRKANDELRKELEGPPKVKPEKKEPKHEKPKGIQDLTTEELRERTARLNAERDYIDAQMKLSALKPEKKTAGQQFAEKMIKDNLVPWAVDMGKKSLEGYVKKQLGLDDSKAEALKKESERLKREADDWTNKKRADQAKEYFRQKEKKTSADSGDSGESKSSKETNTADDARAKAQKQVDDYNKNWWKNDSVKGMGSYEDNDRNNRREYTNKPLLGDGVEEKIFTGKDVFGKGNSKFTGWDKSPIKDVVWDGQKYVDELLGLPDPDKRIRHSDEDSEIFFSDELMHYGVLGMKWGVRRTPEQLGRRTIPKGTTMYRSTVNANESITGHKYVTYLPPDRDMYRGTYAKILRRNAGKSKDADLYENTYILKKDIKVPSREEVKSVISELKAKDKKNEIAIENGKAFCKRFIDYNSWEAFEMVDSAVQEGKIKKYPKTEKEYIEAVNKVHKEVVNNYVKRYQNMPIDELFTDTTRSFGTSEKNRTRVINELKKRGYNAMVDEAGVGSNKGGREGVDPLIIFDGDESLNKVSTTKVDARTERKASRKNDQWYRVANSNRNRGDW